MKWIAGGVLLLACAAAQFCSAQGQSILGEWQDPGGSILRIDRCDEALCIWIVAIGRKAPETMDVHNPELKLRNRPLCGLKIGDGFRPSGAQSADDGTLYDPKTGKTYHGAMRLAGNELHLRGYVGFSIFGRTETWQRPSGNITVCALLSGR